MENQVDLFFLGPPKTASTWIYHCLKEHPGVAAPRTDMTHFFDIHFHRGYGWYWSLFDSLENGKIIFEPTPTYICSRDPLQRILEHNPSARFLIGLRNPLDRAFSHYWHLKKNGRITWQFEEVLSNYNTFHLFIQPGLIANQVQFLLERTSREKVLFVPFEQLSQRPDLLFRNLLSFCGLPDDFKPSCLDKKINIAGPRHTVWSRAVFRLGKTLLGNSFYSDTPSARFFHSLSGKSEYLRGIPSSIRQSLLAVCREDIEHLEILTGMDLSHWKT